MKKIRVCGAKRNNESPSGAFKRLSSFALAQDGGTLSRQVLCGAMAAVMTVSLAGCAKSESDSLAASEETTAEGTVAQAGSSYTGTVTAVSAVSLTVETEADGEVTVPLSDSTTFTRGGMGGLGGDGQTPPEKPDGDNSGDGNAPGDANGQGGAAPDGNGQAPADNGGTPPEKPDGDAQSGDNAGTPPEKSDGDSTENGQPAGDQSSQPGGDGSNGQGGAQDMPGEQEELTYESISVGDTVTVTVGDDGTAAAVELAGGMGQGGPGGGGSSQPESYTAATEFTADDAQSGMTYASTGSDENALHVYNGATVSLDNAAITRDSDDSTGGDASSFYGVGAAALVTDGTLKISDSTITTDAKGGAGVFAYGDGTAYVSGTTISTSQDTSGGIHVAGGGTLYAWDLSVETQGESSAAIRSDRGSGTMVVDGGTYTSNGSGSPALYSTADITVRNATLTANGAEALCIEGLNTARLFDCDLTGDIPENSQNDCNWNVILYQSMSGDSEVGNSTFEMVGGSLTAKNGGMFYTTNTESTFLLSGVDITPSASNDFFLKCTGNSNARGWGQSGANGADCSFTGRDQEMTGDVIWDSISQLDFYVLDGSTLTGAVVDDESNAGNGGAGYANVYIDSGSTWVVTGDSTVTNLYSAGVIVDENGAAVTIVGTNGTVYVQGTSDVTVTVGSYSTSVDTTGAAEADSWEDYAVDKA